MGGGGYGNSSAPYMQRSHLHPATTPYDATQNTGRILRSAPRIWQQETDTAPPTFNAAPMTQTGTKRIPDAIEQKEAQRVVTKIVTDMGCSKNQDAFVGIPADPHDQLSWKSDPVLFTGKLRRIMSNVQGAAWTMSVGVLAIDGAHSARPRADTLTPMRVECFSKLTADTLATWDMIRPHAVVEVPLVEGGFCHMSFKEVTTTERFIMLVAEVSQSEQVQKELKPPSTVIRFKKGSRGWRQPDDWCCTCAQ